MSAEVIAPRSKILIFERGGVTSTPKDTARWSHFHAQRYSSLGAVVTSALKDTHLLARLSLPRSKILIFWRGCDFRAQRYSSFGAGVTSALKDTHLLARL
jgi:hypothetical protein